MALWGNHILRFPCCVQHCTYGLSSAPEGEGSGGGGDLVVVALIHQWNLTLCPDGTKSGLQLMGTRPSSKGHLAGISHTPPHTDTHISNPRYAHANWFSARPSHPFVYTDMVELFRLLLIYMFLYQPIVMCESHFLLLHCKTFSWYIYCDDLLVYVLDQ